MSRFTKLIVTWSITANVDESIIDVGDEHCSVLAEGTSTGEQRVLQRL